MIFKILKPYLLNTNAQLKSEIIFIIKDNIKSSFESNSEIIEGKLYYLIKLPQHVTFFNKGYFTGDICKAAM